MSDPSGGMPCASRRFIRAGMTDAAESPGAISRADLQVAADGGHIAGVGGRERVLGGSGFSRDFG